MDLEKAYDTIDGHDMWQMLIVWSWRINVEGCIKFL